MCTMRCHIKTHNHVYVFKKNTQPCALCAAKTAHSAHGCVFLEDVYMVVGFYMAEHRAHSCGHIIKTHYYKSTRQRLVHIVVFVLNMYTQLWFCKWQRLVHIVVATKAAPSAHRHVHMVVVFYMYTQLWVFIRQRIVHIVHKGGHLCALGAALVATTMCTRRCLIKTHNYVYM